VSDFAVDVAEVQALRQEIITRVTLASTLIALELTALAAGLAILDKSKHILIVLAAMSSFLWLLWLDHSVQTLKLAAYLGTELAPRLTERARRPLLGWEGYLRQINAGGELSGRALYGDDAPKRMAVVRVWRVDWYSPLLFGVAPLALATSYCIANITRPTAPAVIWVGAVVACLVLWGFTLFRFGDFWRNARVIDGAILTHSVCGPATVAVTAHQPGRPLPRRPIGLPL
jgi:hypothetical protein